MKRYIIFTYPDGTQEKYQVGDKSDYGTVQQIWYEQRNQLMARVTTDEVTVVFRGIPYAIVDEAKGQK